MERNHTLHRNPVMARPLWSCPCDYPNDPVALVRRNVKPLPTFSCSFTYYVYVVGTLEFVHQCGSRQPDSSSSS
uniref:Uncharacterized protein n=1 Tax=Physcomitrium patens TaxID=3218 RepID=A0A2K1JMT6_PHYPA|nr:hypothetical protein PHYPA_017680 [Physcomitrium patens]